MKKLGMFTLIFTLMISLIPMATLAKNATNLKPTVIPKPEMIDPFAQLNLTAEQQKKMLEIQQNFRNDNKSLMIDMQKVQLQLQQLWGENPLNQPAIEAKDKEFISLRIQLVTKSRAMIQQIINSVLTPEQRGKFQSIIKNQIPTKTAN